MGFYINKDDIKEAVEFGGKVDEACATIQEGAGCMNCPVETECVASLSLPELYCVSTEKWLEFFGLADDIETRNNFEGDANYDRNDDLY